MKMLVCAALTTMLFLSGSSPAAENEPRIALKLDFSQADAVIAAMDAGEISDSELTALMADYGTQQAIKHSAMFDSSVTMTAWKNGFLAAVAGKPIDSDPLQFNRLYLNRGESKILLDKIRQDPNGFTNGIEELIKPYLPDTVTLQADIFLVAGGNSSGWTDQGGEFFLDVRAAKDDYAGFQYLAAHELYHLVLGEWLPAARTRRGTRYRMVELILLNTIDEGMAEHVVDFSVLGPGAIADTNQRISRRNQRRVETNFALYDAMIYYAFNSEDTDPSTNSVILLSGLYDEVGYYLGGLMAATIEADRGRNGLLELLRQPPTRFFLEYQSIAKQSDELSPFAPGTEDILRQLDTVLSR